MMNEQLINHLREYRMKGEGLTQQGLAELVGVSRQTIISIEKGKFRPSVELALRLARAFEASVEDLFSLKDNQEDES